MECSFLINGNGMWLFCYNSSFEERVLPFSVFSVCAHRYLSFEGFQFSVLYHQALLLSTHEFVGVVDKTLSSYFSFKLLYTAATDRVNH